MTGEIQPLISYAALERAFSAQRLMAYKRPEDRDERDVVARYLWNLALTNAIQPDLHCLEVTFRNEIARAAARLTATRTFQHADIPSWLDAYPTMLMDHEHQKVLAAKQRLGTDPRVRNEGQLIARLDFGFWVALCRDSYSDTRGDGPRLWPRALTMAFQKRPPELKTRAEIHRRFDHIRQIRNRLAHHEPIWDRNYLAEHQLIIDSLGWMSPRLAGSLAALSPAYRTFEAGPAAYHGIAITLLGSRSSRL